MKCARQTCGGPARLRNVFAAGTGIGWRSSRCNRLFVLPLGLVVDAALRVHGGVLASTPVLWIAVQVESDALDSNGDSLTERTCLLVRIKIRGLFCRYGRQNWDRTTYRMSILASEGIEPLFRLRRRAHLERPRALRHAPVVSGVFVSSQTPLPRLSSAPPVCGQGCSHR